MRRPRLGSLCGVAFSLILLFPVALSADDGRFEIDIDCVTTGCFAGDSGGVGTAAFPVTIANAGSYVLTSNIDAAAMMGNIAIAITGSNVFLDLNGFFVSGVGLMELGALNITGSNVEVKNGRVTSLGAGITASGGQIRLVNLRVSSSGGQGGIDFGEGMGSDNQVLDTIVAASSFGIAAPGDRSRIVGCQVSGGTTDGIVTGSKSIVADNIVTNVTGTGADGIETGPSSLVSGNLVQGMVLGDGIEVGAASLVRGNVVSNNGDLGINVGTDALVIGNTVVANAGGNIEACMACSVVDNHGQ